MNIQKLLKIFIVVVLTGLVIQNGVFAKYVNNPNKKIVNTVMKPSYTVASAKAEAFKNVKTYLPYSYYKADLVDKYYAVNIAYLGKGISAPSDESRFLFPSYIGEMLISYGVRYANKPENVYFYNSKGNLMRIEIDNNNPDVYPKKSLTYNNKGKLHSVVLYVTKTEQYNFDGMGNLVVHWIGERGFNKSGQLLKIKRSL